MLTTEDALVPTRKALDRLIAPKTFAEALEIATKLATSDLVPMAYRGKPANIVIAWEMGAELGLSPMTSLHSIAVINGKPGLYGEAPLAIIMASGLLEDMKETWDPEKEVATCMMKRRGFPSEVTRSFGMKEAREAKLYDKDKGAWVPLASRWSYQYWGSDMCMYRARGRTTKTLFADVLKGVDIGEERRDLGASLVDETNVIPVERVAPDEYAVREKPEAPVETVPAPQGVEAPAGPVDTAPGEIVAPAPVPVPKAPRSHRARKVTGPVETAPAPVLAAPPVVLPEQAEQAPMPGEPDEAPEEEPQAELLGAPEARPGVLDGPPLTGYESVDAQGWLLYEIGGVPYQTAGIRLAQMLKTFELVPKVDRMVGQKGFTRTMLDKQMGWAPGTHSRKDLTAAQAAKYIAALERALAGGPQAAA